MLVDILLQLIVEPEIALVHRRWLHELVVAFLVRRLAAGLSAQVLVARPVEGIVVEDVARNVVADREVVLVGKRRCQIGGVAPQRNVMRIGKGRHDEPRAVVARRIEILDQRHDLLGDRRIATAAAFRCRGAAAQRIGAVRLRTDPSFEAVCVELVCRQIDPLLGRIGIALGVVARQRRTRSGHVQVRFGCVPLALPERPVTARPQIMAKGRNQVGHQPKHLRVLLRLGGAVRVGGAVQ